MKVRTRKPLFNAIRLADQMVVDLGDGTCVLLNQPTFRALFEDLPDTSPASGIGSEPFERIAERIWRWTPGMPEFELTLRNPPVPARILKRRLNARKYRARKKAKLRAKGKK